MLEGDVAAKRWRVVRVRTWMPLLAEYASADGVFHQLGCGGYVI